MWGAYNLPLFGLANPPQQSTDLLDIQLVSGITIREALESMLASHADVDTRLPAALQDGCMKSNIHEVAGIVVTGSGTSGDPWGP